MKSFHVTSFVLALSSTLSIARAAEPPTPTVDDCGAKQTQTDMNICFGVRYKAADAALEQAYLDLTVRLNEGSASAKLLGEAEDAWEKYRDKHCAFVASATEGGTVQSTILSQCLTDTTEARAQEIRAQLNCVEGDLACVSPQQPDN